MRQAAPRSPAVLVGIAVCLLLLAIACYVLYPLAAGGAGPAGPGAKSGMDGRAPGLAELDRLDAHAPLAPLGPPEPAGLLAPDDADPEVTGQLYTRARLAGEGRRWTAAPPAASGDSYQPFSADTAAGGVDVVPAPRRPIAGGGCAPLPGRWLWPTDPIRPLAPVHGEDAYDVDAGGPALGPGAPRRALYVPDHDDLTN